VNVAKNPQVSYTAEILWLSEQVLYSQGLLCGVHESVTGSYCLCNMLTLEEDDI